MKTQSTLRILSVVPVLITFIIVGKFSTKAKTISAIDEDDTENMTTYPTTGNPNADSIIAKIKGCSSIKEFHQIVIDNHAAFFSLPEDIRSIIESISMEKGLYLSSNNKQDTKIISTGDTIEEGCYENWGIGEGFTTIKIGRKFGFIDENDKVVIPLIYDDAGTFQEGLASVCINGKTGYIDKSGKIVIPMLYDDSWFFSEGLANVGKDGKWGYIDKKGDIIIPMIYDWTTDFNEGLAAVMKNRKWGYIDKGGNIVIPIIYDNAEFFVNGHAKVVRDSQVSYVDRNGNFSPE